MASNQSRLSSLARAVVWHRRWLAALAAALAVWIALGVLSPKPPEHVSVVVAARHLAGGAKLGADDLSVVQMPAEVVPEGAATTISEFTGRMLAAPRTKGTPLTSADVVDSAGRAKGEVLAPIRLADAAVVQLIKVGSVVNVIAVDDAGQPKILAKAARVALVPTLQQDGGVLSSKSENSGLVVIATDEATASALAAWSQHSSLNITLV